jgi:hypothetical protein
LWRWSDEVVVAQVVFGRLINALRGGINICI